MKNKTVIASILLVMALTACLASTPEPITAATDVEFTLSTGQTASLNDAALSITLISVSSDERCPSEIECAASGPVTLNLSILNKDGSVSEEVLQTFTDYTGLAPTMEFEGIKSSVVLDEYQIKVLRVLPYPKNRTSSIKPSEYKVTLQVTGK